MILITECLVWVSGLFVAGGKVEFKPILDLRFANCFEQISEIGSCVRAYGLSNDTDN